jgi:hypothetical protein
MLSLRLDPELDELVRNAAQREGTSVSEFMRRAAHERARRTLDGPPSEQLADVIGVVSSSGGQARRTGDAFAESLADRRRR